MLKINIYFLVDSYQIDIWDGMEVIEEYNINAKSYNYKEQIKKILAKYDYYRLKNETGLELC